MVDNVCSYQICKVIQYISLSITTTRINLRALTVSVTTSIMGSFEIAVSYVNINTLP